MLNRAWVAVVLSASMSCVGQVVIIGGTATSAAPGAPLSAPPRPIISTPDIALPGSGNAVGAPLSSAAANDSRWSTGPSVYDPNAAPLAGFTTYSGADTQLISSTTPIDEGQASSTSLFEVGIQHFESGLFPSPNRTQSLGEIALLYRQRQNKPSRSFNNDSIADLNVRGVRTGNLGPETSTLAHSSSRSIAQEMLMAQDQAPALPQSDREQSPAVPTSMRGSTSVAAQQRHPNADPIETTPQADSSAQGKTAGLSPLPLLILLTGLGVAGVLYWLKR
jgi:hypothetical protein